MIGQIKGLYEQAMDNLSQDALNDAQQSIKTGANTIFDAARNNPRTTAAVILGAGLAAAALWVLREPQRLAAVKKGITARMRGVRQISERTVRAKRERRPSA